MKKLAVLMLLAAVSLTACKHEHQWAEATCTTPRTCTKCNETEGEPLGHTWKDADCTTPKTCSVCGETEGEPAGHKWVDATCAAPKTCSVCGETEGDVLPHTWVDTTCAAPKTCSVCGETEGEALPHTMKEANYQEPATCTVCGATEGEPLTADFVKEGYTAGLEVGETFQYEFTCYEDTSKKTTADVTITDYETFDSDETHEAKEGYEWKTITVLYHYDDDNARNYGYRYGEVSDDYYNMDLARDSNEVVDEYEDGHASTTKINYHGEEMNIYSFSHASGEWYYPEDAPAYAEAVLTVSFQVPVGYDGIVISFYDPFLWPDADLVTLRNAMSVEGADKSLIFRMD